jgi:hypothetical protein
MGRRKQKYFKLSPDWLLAEPIDFEYNKYTLLDYIQKCENSFDSFKIYPDFVEISLHLANIQSVHKEKTLLLVDKNFEFCDDEILLKELYPQKLPQLSSEQLLEVQKTLLFSNNKLMDTFNLGKSLWSVVYESVNVTNKKNLNNLQKGHGYVYHNIKGTKEITVWEYSLRKVKKHNDTRLYMDLIWSGDTEGKTVNKIILENTNWGEISDVRKLPVFEVICGQAFPYEETLVPMIKRKVLSYILQSVPKEELDTFDFSKSIS